MWADTQNPEASWTYGVQIHDGKIYFQGKLCVPESLTQRILWEFHIASGHLGIHRMTKEVDHRYIFPTSVQHTSIIDTIRRTCTICQASAPPRHPREGNLQHFPVPERAMHTVCLDIFSMPPTSWEGNEYDSILLCVDRLSGWIVASPTTKLGLTAEKAVHLMMERG